MKPIDFANETFLKPGEVAELLQISKAQVYRLIRNGALPHIRIIGTVRIPQSHLEKALQNYYTEMGESNSSDSHMQILNQG